MPSGMAMKPGDVVRSINGTTIQIDHTDCEGRLLLADGLIYAQNVFKPRMMIDIGTLTTGMKAALGNAASGVFTNSTALWRQLLVAASITGDRVWRFPLWEHFTVKVTGLPSADVSNLGWGPGGNPCRAAAFLKEFIHCGDWIHLDIASSGLKADTEEFTYLTPRRMTGRPTRTLIQFLYQLACPPKEKQ
ncbi:cytosol aminopeptidase [Anabrus simplex]|uniref:cytosol aminopeptidase n=1 Tax=Anabrus simplex TaxID=316456 RepID=UPI0034DD92E0